MVGRAFAMGERMVHDIDILTGNDFALCPCVMRLIASIEFASVLDDAISGIVPDPERSDGRESG